MSTRIPLYQSNSRTILLRLRKRGSAGYADVSEADTIMLEYETEDGVLLDSIECLSDVPGADWVNGLVVADVSAVCAQATGTYKWGLTLVIGGETITWTDGDFELATRPGSPIPQ